MKAFGNIAKDSQVRAVASGTLPSGRPVVVNSDGTVSVVAETSATLGTEGAFNSLNSGFNTTVFDSSNNKHIIVYRTSSNLRYVVATVASDGSVSFGTDAVVLSGDHQQCASVFDSTNNRVVVVFRNGNDSDNGYAIVGSLSGTTVTWGSATEFNNANSAQLGISFDSTAGKVVISYRNYGNSSYGTAIVGTVSGTSISFGTPVVFNSGSTGNSRSVHDSTNNKTVLFWADGDDGAGKGDAVVGTISGTSISFGSTTRFEAGALSHSGIAFDSDTGKVVIAYRQNHETDGATDHKRGTAIVGTVSGTSISFGTAVAFDNTGDYGESSHGNVIYDSNAKKVLVVYPRTVSGSYSNRGYVFPLKVSGTTVVADTPTEFTAGAATGYTAISFDSNVNKSLIVFKDNGNSEYGTAVSFSPLIQNLTSENYIGMSSGTAFQTGSDTSVGSEAEFITNMGNEISNGVFDPDSNKVILAYSDQDTGVDGTAIVGTVSGTSISFGTPTVYNTSETTHIGITYDTTNDKVVIVYRDGAGNNNYGNAIVGTVSGTSISFGTAVVYNSALSQYNAAAFDANSGKILIAYKDADSTIQSRVATVSGTGISFGTEVEVDGGGNHINTVYDSNSNKVVVIFTDSSNSNYGSARVGTISGTDVSYGTLAVMVSSITEDIHSAFDSTNNKIVVGYKDGGDGDKGKAFVGTVSGTDISFGSGVVVHNASTSGFDGVVYNSNLDKVFFFYRDSSTLGKFVSGTVSGTAVGSVSSETTYHNASTNVPFHVYDGSSTNIVAAYRDAGDSNKGKAVVVKPDDRATTRAQIADGGNAVIDSTNAISRNQIGLTAGQTLYVQTDGTLSETAGSPSVTAGTAISATEIIVKG